MTEDEYIQNLLATAPPLTPEQERLIERVMGPTPRKKNGK